MKELLTISSNCVGYWDNKERLHRRVELILILSEPVYELDPTGEIIKQRETSTFRFLAAPKSLRALALAIVEAADEADKLVPPDNP